MLREIHVLLGTDPEGFFERGGRIIGSEKVLPPEGIGLGGKVVLDGVQFEIHTAPVSSTNLLGTELTIAFNVLRSHLRSHPEKDIAVCLKSMVDIEKAELESLKPEHQVLGCAPSRNLYDGAAAVNVDGRTYLKRSGGGHIQLGLPFFMLEHRPDLVALMDVIVGNTCVLIDRDPWVVERRKNYGRAGEFRIGEEQAKPKPSVLEYRTLSNFWLRSMPLTQLVFELSRLAVAILGCSLLDKTNLDVKLMDMIDLDKVKDAINNNDYEKALETFVLLREFIMVQRVPGPAFGLNCMNLDQFDKFLKLVQDRGLENVFSQDPFEHWTFGPRPTWQGFLAGL